MGRTVFGLVHTWNGQGANGVGTFQPDGSADRHIIPVEARVAAQTAGGAFKGFGVSLMPKHNEPYPSPLSGGDRVVAEMGSGKKAGTVLRWAVIATTTPSWLQPPSPVRTEKSPEVRRLDQIRQLLPPVMPKYRDYGPEEPGWMRY